jgi:hypothetical protein
LMVLAGMVTYLPPVISLTFERRDSIAHDVAHVGVVLIEARDLIQHTLVYTTHVCTENRPRRANLHDWKSSERGGCRQRAFCVQIARSAVTSRLVVTNPGDPFERAVSGQSMGSPPNCNFRVVLDETVAQFRPVVMRITPSTAI